MVAKFSDDNKPKRHLTSGFALFQTSSILFNFTLFCQMLAKFSGLNPKGPYVSLGKEKQNFCVVLSYYIKRAREIRKFHVAVVQQRLRNVKNAWMQVQRSFFCQSKPIVFLLFAVAVAETPYCFHQERMILSCFHLVILLP